MIDEEKYKAKRIVDSEGKEHIIVLECEIRGRKFIVTTNKKIFERNEENIIRECTNQDEEIKFLSKYLEEPKILDVKL